MWKSPSPVISPRKDSPPPRTARRGSAGSAAPSDEPRAESSVEPLNPRKRRKPPTGLGQPPHLGVAEARGQMVVDEPRRLQEGVADRGADEAEPSAPEVA